jgi:hypothetical protein
VRSKWIAERAKTITSDTVLNAINKMHPRIIAAAAPLAVALRYGVGMVVALNQTPVECVESVELLSYTHVQYYTVTIIMGYHPNDTNGHNDQK